MLIQIQVSAKHEFFGDGKEMFNFDFLCFSVEKEKKLPVSSRLKVPCHYDYDFTM